MNREVYPIILLKANLRVCLVAALFIVVLPHVYSNTKNKKHSFVLVLDPGHGGKDPGAIGKNSCEKDVVLQIALKVGAAVKKSIPDAKVIYTRETDVFIPLAERAEIANKNKADLFISIHTNSSKNKVPCGVETFLMGESKEDGNLSVAKAENAVILKEDDYSSKYGGYDPNAPESFMIFSLIQNSYHTQSLNFATSVQTFLKKNRSDRGVKQAGFLVLWKTAMPSVLIETGFISNLDEEKYLNSAKGQENISNCILSAVSRYANHSSGRSAMLIDSDEPSSTTATASTFDTVVNAPTTEPEKPNTIDTLVQTEATTQAVLTDKRQNVFFVVQITSSKKPISTSSPKFKGLKGIEQLPVNDGFKYIVGRKQTYSEVSEYCKHVKTMFPDAFIIAVRDRKIIPLSEALKEIKD